MLLWQNAKISEAELDGFIECRRIPRPIAMTLLARGVGERELDSFLTPRLKFLSDPYDLPGVEEAASRIWKAVSQGEKILVYGDYDTDGITAATVVCEILSQNDAQVTCFLPHRFDDGYGFTVDALDKALEKADFGLIVTVDCGMTGKDTVEFAKSRGIDVIVSDHHEPDGHIPDAYAIINPRLHGDVAGWAHLAGVGVAFKLCHGFVKYGREHNLGAHDTDLKGILDLVALGTVADIVPLLEENRILVSHGLKSLESQIRPGVRALCEASGLEAGISPSNISFGLAPLLNAAGRFGSPDDAFRILNTDNIVEAHDLAESLKKSNIERRLVENEMFESAVAQFGDGAAERRPVTVAGSGWHQGVAGIVAARLARTYNAPAIVLCIDGDTAKGSCRSVGGFNLVELLGSCSLHLECFGGHPMAAGLTLKTSRIPEFYEAFAAVVSSAGLGSYAPVMDYDGDVRLAELDDGFFDYIGNLEPFGFANPEPVYRIAAVEPMNVAPAAVRHTRGILKDSSGDEMNFIAFNISTEDLPPRALWDVLATPQMNTFRGISSPQLMVKAIRTADET
ncbi:MAG: single-stranded-DNA-specific exonuclease RecJ [Victivallales bacterium]|nr:single-stranded-DNA-specific exonuclease RecJ [Victivallales bacterium]